MRLGGDSVWDFPCIPPSVVPLIGTCGYLPHPVPPLLPAVQAWVDHNLTVAVGAGPWPARVLEKVWEGVRAGMAYQASRAASLSQPGPYN